MVIKKTVNIFELVIKVLKGETLNKLAHPTIHINPSLWDRHIVVIHYGISPTHTGHVT